MSIILAGAALCQSPFVEDGDTIRCGTERVRLAQIDAPELSSNPRCWKRGTHYLWCDETAGLKARAALERFLAQGKVRIVRLGYDRFGRTVARVYVQGSDASEHLRQLGLVKRWYGRQVVRRTEL